MQFFHPTRSGRGVLNVEASISSTDGCKMVEGYCLKCKAKKQIKDPTQTTLKNGKSAVKGTCPDCGTGVFRIGAKL